MNNQINEQPNSANRITILVIILIVSLALAGFFLFKYFSNKKLIEETREEAAKIQIKEIPKSENPVGMPYNLPIDPGSRILQNYESTSPTGQIQSTRKLSTNTSAEASLVKYSKFFEDLGWKRNVSGPLVSPLAYSSPLGSLMIVVNPGLNNKGSEVEITILNPIKPESK
ncbi:hypothetical protein IPM19_04415 [bacterium]|nr:MAG: hypothetical protein IPM19_04415 [bacterium]